MTLGQTTGSESTGSVDPTHPAVVWRLIVGGEADGATNMAVDEAILTSVREGATPPTLRLYGWSPPCLSLGRNQPLADVDLGACRAAGVDVVRRPTGGRGILHIDELTYCVTLPQADPLADGGVLESYRRLSEGLLAGLGRLGVEAIQVIGEQDLAADLTAICFDTPSNYEITVGGRKLVGSAQWRARGGVLQHGSLPLHGDITRIVSCLTFSDSERVARREALHRRATTLEETLGRRVPFDQMAQAMASGFAQALNLTMAPGELTAQEHALAMVLRRERYAASGWTART